MREKVWSILYFGISVLVLIVLPSLATNSSFIFAPVFFVVLIGILVSLVCIGFGLGSRIFDDRSKFFWSLVFDIFAIWITIAILLEVIFIFIRVQ